MCLVESCTLAGALFEDFTPKSIDHAMPVLLLHRMLVGIGVGTLLAFPLGMAGVGIWLGLASGLGAVALLLIARWTMRERLGLVPD